MNKKGVSIIAAIFIMLVLSLIIAAVASLVATSGDVAINYWESLETFYIAEAGLAWARVKFSPPPVGDWTFEQPHQASRSIGAGAFTVTTSYDSAPDAVTITSTGYVPDSSTPRSRRVVVERDIPPIEPITATASSGVKARPASDAIDGDLTTYWESRRRPLPHWLRLTFINPIVFDKVIFYQNTVNITEFHIEYYDGASSVPVNDPVIDGPEGSNNMITVTFGQVESGHVQLVVDETVTRGARPNISEFEVYLGEEKGELGGWSLGKGTFMEIY